MNFWKNLHPLLRRDNKNDYGSANNAVLSALADSLSDAEQDTVAKRAQLILETATGAYLDEWGTWFGVTRRTDEDDNAYRERIEYFFLIPRSTVEGIIKGIQYYLDDSDAKISIYEPWKNIFYLNKSKLNGDDHLQGFYYRYAVIDVSIDRPMSKTIYDAIMAFKPAGVKFYVTFNPNINSKVHKLTVAELKARKLFTVDKAYGFMYDHKLPVTFSDRPSTLVNNTNYLKLNDSKLNGEDVLAGSPTHNVTYWNPLRLSYSPYKDVGGGTNLLSNSRGKFQPNKSTTDNYVVYYDSTVYMTQGQQYTVHADASPGLVWSGMHHGDVESNHIVLWLIDEKTSIFTIISDANTGTGTTFTWNNPSGTYCLRVNTYKVDNSGYAENVMLEEGTVAHPWSPNPADPEYFVSTPTNRAILSSPSDTYVSLPLPSSNSPYKDVPVNLLTGTGNHTVTGTGTNDYLSNETNDDFLTLFKELEGQTVTVSVDYEYSGFVAGSGSNRLGWEIHIFADTSTYVGPWYYPKNSSGSGRMSSTFVVPKNITGIAEGLGYIQFSGGTGTLSHLKIEKGSVATPWCPNMADPEYLGSAPTHMLSGTLSVYNQFITNYSSLLSTYSGNTEYDRVRSLVEDTHTTVSLVINADVPLTINGVLYPAGVSSTPVDKGSLNYTGSDITIPVSVTGTQDARVYYVYAKLKVTKDIPGLGVNIKASQNVSIIKNGPVVGTAVVGTAVLGQETIIGNTK